MDVYDKVFQWRTSIGDASMVFISQWEDLSREFMNGDILKGFLNRVINFFSNRLINERFANQ